MRQGAHSHIGVFPDGESKLSEPLIGTRGGSQKLLVVNSCRSAPPRRRTRMVPKTDPPPPEGSSHRGLPAPVREPTPGDLPPKPVPDSM